jgi:hypothetical protein
MIAMAARRVLNADLVRSAGSLDGYLRPDDLGTRAVWNLTASLLRETAATVRKAGAVYIPMRIPANIELSERYWKTSWLQERPADVDESLPQRRFQAMLSDIGVELIDLAPSMRKIGPTPLYYSVDPHWTAQGHRVAGEVLAPTIARALRQTAR